MPLFLIIAVTVVFPRIPGDVAERLWLILPVKSTGVSVEMRERIHTDDRRAVTKWLTAHRDLFRSAEARFGIDRRAVAGVIAAEALNDVKPYWFMMRRASGLGKVHYREYWTSEGDPVAKQAEDLGLLPKRTMAQRRSLLATDAGAVRYIAAIMDGFALVSRMPPIRCNLGALATLFSAWDYRDIRSGQWVLPIRRSEFNAMGNWVQNHQEDLARWVGIPRLTCRGAASSTKIR